jgi:hypothetical protein
VDDAGTPVPCDTMVRSCKDLDKEAAFSAILEMAGERVEVVGVRGSIFIRIYDHNISMTAPDMTRVALLLYVLYPLQ